MGEDLVVSYRARDKFDTEDEVDTSSIVIDHYYLSWSFHHVSRLCLIEFVARRHEEAFDVDGVRGGRVVRLVR